MPVVVPEVITHVNVHDSIPHQELPYGRHPQPRSSKAPRQQSSLIPRPRQSNPVQNHYPNQQGNYTRQGQRKTKKSERHMDHIPMSYNILLLLLLMHSLVRLREPGPPPTPLPPDHDVNARCVFHFGAPGHTTEDCRGLKHLVQDLIDSKVIVFTPQGMNVVRTHNTSQTSTSAVSNPYLNQHQNYYQQGIQGPRRPPRKFDPIPMPYSHLLAYLLRDSLVQLREAKAPPVPLPPGYDMNVSYEYHSRTPGHSIENCNVFKHKVQDLINSKAISFVPTVPNVMNNPTHASTSAMP